MTTANARLSKPRQSLQPVSPVTSRAESDRGSVEPGVSPISARQSRLTNFGAAKQVEAGFTTYRDYEAPVQPKSPSGFLAHVWAWIEELVWCLLIVVIFIVLVVVLSQYDNKHMPNWPMGLTLNTLVAFLATVCRAMTLVPIIEGVSQLKWNWFATKQRSLRELYLFDQASRGPFGALRLLPKTRGRFILLIVLATLIYALGLVTSFLTQSAIAYRYQTVQGTKENCNVGAARSYPMALRESGIGDQDLLDAITNSAYQATFLPFNDSWPAPGPVCSSSGCSWEPFSSLAVCVSMANVTSRLSVKKVNSSNSETIFNVSLPNSIAYVKHSTDDNEAIREIVNMTSPGTNLEYNAQLANMSKSQLSLEDFPYAPFPDERISFANASNPDLLRATFSQFFFIYSNYDPDEKYRYRAVELLYHFCVNEYSVSVVDGTARTTVTNTTTRIRDIERFSPTGSNGNSFTLENKYSSQTFNITAVWSYDRLPDYFRQAFSGGWSSSWQSGRASIFNRRFGMALYNEINTNTSSAEFDRKTWDNLEHFSTRIADAMTSYIRTNDQLGGMTGDIMDLQQYVEIRWGWMAFLAAQITITIMFLVSVMIHTAILEVGIVKSANTAELFALQQGEHVGIKGVVGIQTIVDSSWKAKLVNDGDCGWKLKLD
ncbi:unnamed protein product [Clonostachys chloroleuca]|uniref:Uncharacterized protein n=1 Tax=Clonostachys chloroleuca TaxID=1926264 RepID=A0AA35QBY2_9HYPO|nr:unnamed protein product [Clonostachys chloroleuca]